MPMNEKEIENQKKLESEILKRVKNGVDNSLGSRCSEIEYKTGAEVTMKISDVSLDCQKGFGDDFYTGCQVEVEYVVETNYKGNSFIEASVECEVEIEYKKRDGYGNSHDSDSESSSITLFSNASERGSMNFDFSFSSYDEVIKVRVVECSCRITDLFLY